MVAASSCTSCSTSCRASGGSSVGGDGPAAAGAVTRGSGWLPMDGRRSDALGTPDKNLRFCGGCAATTSGVSSCGGAGDCASTLPAGRSCASAGCSPARVGRKSLARGTDAAKAAKPGHFAAGRGGSCGCVSPRPVDRKRVTPVSKAGSRRGPGELGGSRGAGAAPAGEPRRALRRMDVPFHGTRFLSRWCHWRRRGVWPIRLHAQAVGRDV